MLEAVTNSKSRNYNLKNPPLKRRVFLFQTRQKKFSILYYNIKYREDKLFNSLKEKAFLKLLDRIKIGEIKVTFPSGITKIFQGDQQGPKAEMVIKDMSWFTQTARSGDIGFGESYMQGKWDTPDLIELIKFFIVNKKSYAKMTTGHPVVKKVMLFLHKLNANTKKGSKRNIQKHYDLGNDFYKLWLDPTMTYSSALFTNEDDSLEAAQKRKYHRILEQLSVKDGKIMEIGCGWGGFATEAANKGFHVDGITISPSQKQYAETRVLQNNHSDQVNIKFVDYRDTKGKYDGICSIEMFEAVGKEYWRQYFAQASKLLNNGKRAVIQTITRLDSNYEHYDKKSDFIRKFIFPGGALPSKTLFKDFAATEGFVVLDQFEFGQSYAKTCKTWLENFDNVIPQVRKMGFDDTFIKMWRFYLAACSAAFSAGDIDVVQFTLEKRAA